MKHNKRMTAQLFRVPSLHYAKHYYARPTREAVFGVPSVALHPRERESCQVVDGPGHHAAAL